MDYKLYLDQPCEGRLGMSTYYMYEDDVLEIRWCGERQWHHLPAPAAVIVQCHGCAPEVVPMQWPSVFRWRVMWLCGVKKQGRCSTMAEYVETCKRFNHEKLRHIGGNGWQYLVHNADNVLIYKKGGGEFIFNFDPDRSYEGYFVPVAEEGEYRVILSTDDYCYGGQGRVAHQSYQAVRQPDGRIGFMIYLPNRTAIVLKKKPVRK